MKRLLVLAPLLLFGVAGSFLIWYFFQTATEGTGGDGTTALAASPGGTAHSFVWNPVSDPGLTPPETLDITVRFDFLDNSDRVVKTERSVVRLAPAESTTIAEPGTMGWEEANRVYTFAVQVENWTIIEN